MVGPPPRRRKPPPPRGEFLAPSTKDDLPRALVKGDQDKTGLRGFPFRDPAFHTGPAGFQVVCLRRSVLQALQVSGAALFRQPRKRLKPVRVFETYVTSHRVFISNYGEHTRQREGERNHFDRVYRINGQPSGRVSGLQKGAGGLGRRRRPPFVAKIRTQVLNGDWHQCGLLRLKSSPSKLHLPTGQPIHRLQYHSVEKLGGPKPPFCAKCSACR